MCAKRSQPSWLELLGSKRMCLCSWRHLTSCQIFWAGNKGVLWNRLHMCLSSELKGLLQRQLDCCIWVGRRKNSCLATKLIGCFWPCLLAWSPRLDMVGKMKWLYWNVSWPLKYLNRTSPRNRYAFVYETFILSLELSFSYFCTNQDESHILNTWNIIWLLWIVLGTNYVL